MDTGQVEAVRDAVRVYRDIRADLATAVPVWPLGLPGWEDRWLSLGLRAGDVTYLAVWRREATATAVTLSLPHLRGRQVTVETLYPGHLAAWAYEWNAGPGWLTVTPTSPAPFSARIFRIATYSRKGPAQ
jgi:alpha-galactosidase